MIRPPQAKFQGLKNAEFNTQVKFGGWELLYVSGKSIYSEFLKHQHSCYMPSTCQTEFSFHVTELQYIYIYDTSENGSELQLGCVTAAFYLQHFSVSSRGELGPTSLLGTPSTGWQDKNKN